MLEMERSGNGEIDGKGMNFIYQTGEDTESTWNILQRLKILLNIIRI